MSMLLNGKCKIQLLIVQLILSLIKTEFLIFQFYEKLHLFNTNVQLKDKDNTMSIYEPIRFYHSVVTLIHLF